VFESLAMVAPLGTFNVSPDVSGDWFCSLKAPPKTSVNLSTRAR
jgi:hypothetical protein